MVLENYDIILFLLLLFPLAMAWQMPPVMPSIVNRIACAHILPSPNSYMANRLLNDWRNKRQIFHTLNCQCENKIWLKYLSTEAIIVSVNKQPTSRITQPLYHLYRTRLEFKLTCVLRCCVRETVFKCEFFALSLSVPLFHSQSLCHKLCVLTSRRKKKFNPVKSHLIIFVRSLQNSFYVIHVLELKKSKN